MLGEESHGPEERSRASARASASCHELQWRDGHLEWKRRAVLLGAGDMSDLFVGARTKLEDGQLGTFAGRLDDPVRGATMPGRTDIPAGTIQPRWSPDFVIRDSSLELDVYPRQRLGQRRVSPGRPQSGSLVCVQG